MVAVSRQENLFKQKSQQLYTTAGSIRGPDENRTHI